MGTSDYMERPAPSRPTTHKIIVETRACETMAYYEVDGISHIVSGSRSKVPPGELEIALLRYLPAGVSALFHVIGGVHMGFGNPA